jgi:tetratricopeptide (TPR) repeat protein
MPQRVRNHVLESLSRDALSLRLTGPLGWVVRDIAIDYGIDVEVEIFETNGNTTGLTFKVQLKGMEKPDHIGPYRDFDVEHLKYWSRLDVPVLLVAYDDSGGKIYGRWVHALDLDLKPDQNSKRIRFAADDEIVAGDPRLRRTVETVRRLRSGQFGRPFPVRLDGERAKGAIRDFFDFVRAVELSDYIRFDRSDFAFSVSLPGDDVRVALPGDVGSFTLHPQYAGSVDERIRDSLLILASLLSRLSRFGEAVQITRRLIGTCRATNSPSLAFELAAAAYEVGDHDLLVGLAVDALNAEAFEAAQIYLLVLRQMPGARWLGPARDVLQPSIRRCVDAAIDRDQPRQAAFWAYNFAQFLFAKEAREDAREWVERAVALDPNGYGSRPEPDRLLGAIAWFRGDMTASIEAYRAAVQKGGLEAPGSALADSLMHAGRHEEAREIIAAVLRAGSDNWRDWFVEAILDELIDHLGLPRQVRRDFPPIGTVLTDRSLEELETFLKDGYALNEFVWLTRSLQHPVERLTTLMAGAYLAKHPLLMAMAIHGIIVVIQEEGALDAARDRLVRLLSDTPEARSLLLSDEAPVDAGIRDLVHELALRSLELAPDVPGVQLVDENNIVLPPEPACDD